MLEFRDIQGIVTTPIICVDNTIRLNLFADYRHERIRLRIENDLRINLTSAFQKTKNSNLSDYQLTNIEEAEFILNTGTHSFDDSVEDYVKDLQIGVTRGLPMICANPDLIVLYGDGEAICAGRLAKEYEKMGGKVYYHGKLSKDIFVKILELV